MPSIERDSGQHESRSHTPDALFPMTSVLLRAQNSGLTAMAVATIVCSLNLNAARADPWIIDTDMGSDDWIAILYAAGKLKGDLKAITVVGNGLSHCPAGRDNASGLLQMINTRTTIPIGCGGENPLDGYASFPQHWRQGSDAMMGQSLPSSSQETRVADLESSALFAQVLRQSETSISVLTIGAMSNLAKVLIREPRLKGKIKEVVAMAGAVDVAGNLRVHNFTDDNPNAKAEWNLYIDPTAARIVFESGIPIRLVSLDVANTIPLTKPFVQRFRRETGGQAADAVANWFGQLLKPELGEYYHWDPLAAVIALNPGLCTDIQVRKLRVIADPDPDPDAKPYEGFSKQPLLNWKGQSRRVLNRLTAGGLVPDQNGKPVHICMKVDFAAFEAKLIEGFQQ